MQKINVVTAPIVSSAVFAIASGLRPGARSSARFCLDSMMIQKRFTMSASRRASRSKKSLA